MVVSSLLGDTVESVDDFLPVGDLVILVDDSMGFNLVGSANSISFDAKEVWPIVWDTYTIMATIANSKTRYPYGSPTRLIFDEEDEDDAPRVGVVIASNQTFSAHD